MIPKGYAKKLNKISEKTGRPLESLESELMSVLDSVKGSEKDLLEPVLWAKAFNKFLGELRRRDGSLMSQAPTFFGMILGDSGVIDFVEILKRRAQSLYSNLETRSDAIEAGIVTRDGIPLDVRERINFQDNPNYGKPFPEDEHSYFRSIYGVASKDLSKFSLFRLNINGEQALEVSYQMWSPVSFKANEKREQKYAFLDLNAPYNNLQFNPIDLKLPDIYSELKSSAWNIWSLSDLEYLHNSYSKHDRSIPLLIEANVAMISKDLSRTGNRILWLDDPELAFEDTGVMCFIPGNMELTFGLDSRVVFIGRVDRLQERYCITAFGYYAIPELTFK